MLNIRKQVILAASAVLVSQTITLANASADSVCFVLGEYNGRIALLEEGNTEPLAVYNTPLSSLCTADAELLKSGIRFDNRLELSRLIEALDLE